MRYHLTPVKMAIIKKTKDNKWQECGEKGHLCTVVGNVSWHSHYGKQYRVPKNQKLNYQNYYPKEISAPPCSLQHYL